MCPGIHLQTFSILKDITKQIQKLTFFLNINMCPGIYLQTYVNP